MEDADRRVRCRSFFSGYELCLLGGGELTYMNPFAVVANGAYAVLPYTDYRANGEVTGGRVVGNDGSRTF